MQIDKSVGDNARKVSRTLHDYLDKSPLKPTTIVTTGKPLKFIYFFSAKENTENEPTADRENVCKYISD